MFNLARRAISWVIWPIKAPRERKIASTSRVWPWNIRGKGASLEIGEHSLVGANIVFDRPDARVRIGARTFIGKSRLVAAESIDIGDDVQISWGVTILDHDSHSVHFSHRRNDVLEWARGRKDWSYVPIGPVKIEDKVWVGFGATILRGVTIGEGAIVSSQAVVMRSIEPWTVVAGNPAREIGRLTPEAAND